MVWDHRIIRSKEHDEIWYGVHEVYYDDAGKIMGWTGPIDVFADTRRGLLWTLAMMAAAVGKPVLEEREDEELVEIEAEISLSPMTLQFIEHGRQIGTRGEAAE